jgi:hypothetical protein
MAHFYTAYENLDDKEYSNWVFVFSYRLIKISNRIIDYH